MKPNILFLGAISGLLAASPLQAQIEFRVSAKFILDAGGNLPSNNGGFGAQRADVTNAAAVQAQIDLANTILDRHCRGTRYRLTEVLNLSGVSQWFSVPARDSGNRNALESAAMANTALYAWRNDAINLYINNTSSAVCSFPGDHNLIFMGSRAYTTLFVHEAGHFFNLSHTHQGESGCADNCGCGATLTPGDSDNVGDTLPDHECWGQDNIASWSFGGRNYSQLNAGEQYRVDNVFLNIMSYHLPQDRFTSDQLDRFADAANDPRSNVVTARTRFVDRNNGCALQNGSSSCGFLFGGPYSTVAGGVGGANSGDIVLIRPGLYNEPGTYTKTVTFRATRGNATIGTP
jgi:hypothetical protein